MKEDRKGLVSGTAVYFLGNMSITIVQLLLLRFVTGKLDPDIYGYFNLIVTIDNLITPLLTLQIGDALFRFFFLSDEEKKKNYYSICMIVLGIGLVVLSVVLLGINIFYKIEALPWIIAYVFSTNAYMIYQKIARSMGMNKRYVQANFVKSLTYMMLQMVCLYIFNWKIESLFFANIVSTIVFIVCLESKIHSLKYFSFKAIRLNEAKEMASYSVPLVPNTMFWWANSSVNNVIISGRLGLVSNGIFSVANKFPNVLNTVANVFMLSWQESMIKDYDNNKGTSSFCNETFNMFYVLIFTAGFAAVPVIRLLFPYIVADSYQSALVYVPVIMLSVCFSNLSGFFGQVYGAVKDTKGIMKSTMLGTVVNLSITIGLIYFIGLWAPIMGTLFSNVVLVWRRYFRFKEQMNLSINIKRTILLIVEGITILLINYYGGLIPNLIAIIGAIALFMVLNIQIIKDFGSVFLSKLRGVKS